MQRGFVLSAGLMALVVVLAVAVAVSGAANGAPHTPPRHPATAAGASSGTTPATASVVRPAGSSGSGGGSVCGLPAGSQQLPLVPPMSRWVLVGSTAAPSSPTVFGPGRMVDGFGECYAHSPTGALFAAMNFWAAGTAFPPGTVYAHLTANTRSRAAVIELSVGDNSRLSDNGTLQFAGYQFSSYSPTDADLSVVLQTTGGALVSVPCTIVWQGGDWKYVIPPNGEPAGGQIDSLDGYTAWSGA